jgi:hypothetical protein
MMEFFLPELPDRLPYDITDRGDEERYDPDDYDWEAYEDDDTVEQEDMKE